MMAHSEDPDSSSVSICPKCGYTNRHGVVFCDDCGAPIGPSAHSTTVTREVPREVLDKISMLGNAGGDTFKVPQPRREFQPGACVFEAGFVARFTNRYGDPILVTPSQREEITFGRSDPDTGYQPEIDLLHYDGLKKGISRRHALLTLEGKRLLIQDLRSSNGTFINDTLLDPMEIHQLRDGDTLRFGTLELQLSFQS